MALNTVTHIVQGFHGSKHFMHDVLRFALWTYSWKKRKKTGLKTQNRSTSMHISHHQHPTTTLSRAAYSTVLFFVFRFHFWAVCRWLSDSVHKHADRPKTWHSLTNCSVARFSATWFSCFVCWWRLETISQRRANTHTKAERQHH